MDNITFKIGDRVNKISAGTNFLKHGIVTGLDKLNNRAFVNWTIHGISSIHLDYLIIAESDKK